MGYYNIAVAAVSIITAGAEAITAASKAKEASERAADGMARLQAQQQALANMDTSNPFADMDNALEDLTINQQAMEYERTQMLQSQANIMEKFRETAGSSGVAALAQSLAQQGQLQAQKSAATVGEQEARNNLLAAQEASRIQGLERQGDMMSRQMQFGLLESQMGMTLQEIAMERGLEYGLGQQAANAATSGIGGVGELFGALEEGGVFEG
tara:strand:+ start:482 stop:1117 length:636 start_codon:yes stop_codon:yes gene_type:complete